MPNAQVQQNAFGAPESKRCPPQAAGEWKWVLALLSDMEKAMATADLEKDVAEKVCCLFFIQLVFLGGSHKAFPLQSGKWVSRGAVRCHCSPV